jgi:hypothetical protein
MRVFRKGNTGAQLSYQGHILMEHRHSLVRDPRVSLASGHGERDTADFVAGCREIGVTPHVAQNITNRRNAIDGRTIRHGGYAVSIKPRAWIETHFGWIKSTASLRQVKQRGRARVEAVFQMTMAANNLIRRRGLLAMAPNA